MILGLLLPYERSQGQNKEKESKRKKTYKKLSNQDKRTIRFAKSIMDSINHLDSRSTIHDMYNWYYNLIIVKILSLLIMILSRTNKLLMNSLTLHTLYDPISLI